MAREAIKAAALSFMKAAPPVFQDSPPPPMKPGVYFLARDDVVVYVGQSCDVFMRIATHFRERKKRFNRAFYIDCAEDALGAAEFAFIKALRPEYNRTTGPNAGGGYPLSIMREACEVAVGFLQNTDEPGIWADDLYHRVIERTRKTIDRGAFFRRMDRTPGVRWDQAACLYRLESPSPAS